MIQRIQSLYLLIATVLLIVASFMPFFTLNNGDLVIDGFYFHSSTGENIFSTITMNIILWLGALLSFITIFLFKNRIVQMRITTYTIIILLGFYLLLIYYRFMAVPSIEKIISSKMEIASLFPVIGAILIYMANRAIKKDEEKVRSMDRFRD